MTDIQRDLERAARRLEGSPPDIAARAAAEGIEHIAYATVHSPWGPWLAAVTAKGLVRLAWAPDDDVVEELARRVTPRVIEAPGRLADVQRQIDEYFDGRRRDFDVPVDLRLMNGFSLRVLQHTARIPFGQTVSYGELAERAGSPRAARAAGNALHNNPVPIVVPCHRVLHASGGLGGYGGGLDRKRELLELEGAL